MNRFRFEAIGTYWEVDTPAELDGALRADVRACAEAFDAVYSRFREDSLVAQMAAAGGTFEFPADAEALFEIYDRLHGATHGAVDPLVGRDLELLGYDRTYTLRPDPMGMERHEADRPSWQDDVIRVGSHLQTTRPLVVDVGAVGKGFLVDMICELLARAGIENCLVDASGDMRHSGGDPVVVGLEHPGDTGQVIGTVRLKDAAICASATNRRAWGDGLHHVIDGRTGTPARDVIATWAIAPSAALADGLATALFFQSGERLRQDFRFTYVRVLADGSVDASDDLDGELFT